MGIRKNTGRIIALSAFLAFITIQTSPLWAKLDYSKTDIPCPIHAMQATQAALYAKHQKRSHEKYTEVAAYLGEDKHTLHDPDIICLPGMQSHSAPAAQHDHSPDEDEGQNNKSNLWACPYCAVKDMAFTPLDDIQLSAPQPQTVAVRYFNDISEPAKISAIRAYHSRAPPLFS